MKKFLLAFVLAVSAFGVPSCYDIHKIEKPSDSSTQKAIFILIDETTPFNEQLKEQILNNALSRQKIVYLSENFQLFAR